MHPPIRSRLRAAMENGFLNARCRHRDTLLKQYGLWCWRMHLPMIWIDQHSPHSRLASVRLDFFTTPGRLTTKGYAELIGLSAHYVPAHSALVSADHGRWNRVNRADAEAFARNIFRTVRRHGNYEVGVSQPGAPLLVPYHLPRTA